MIERSQTESDRGLSVATEMSENLEKISKSVNDVSTLVVEISASSGEQATGIKQINTAVNEMDKTVQNNASNSEESASAAEELSSQAAELRGMIDELIELVGNTAQRGSRTRGFKNKTIKIDHSNTSYDDIRSGSFEKTSKSNSLSKPNGKVNARDLIPLDDVDLNGF